MFFLPKSIPFEAIRLFISLKANSKILNSFRDLLISAVFLSSLKLPEESVISKDYSWLQILCELLKYCGQSKQGAEKFNFLEGL